VSGFIGATPSRKRISFSAEFKARVALDALSGEHTLSELAGKYGVHPNQISQWKKQAKDGIVASFAGKGNGAPQTNEAQIKELHAKIGQLTVEKDFFGTSLRPNMSCERRREVVDKGHPDLSVRRQCRILKLQRSTYYYLPIGESSDNWALMRRIESCLWSCRFLASGRYAISCGMRAIGWVVNGYGD